MRIELEISETETRTITLVKYPSQMALLQIRAAQARIGAKAAAVKDAPAENASAEERNEHMCAQLEMSMGLLSDYQKLVEPYFSQEDMDIIREYLPLPALIELLDAVIATREVPAALQGKSRVQPKR